MQRGSANWGNVIDMSPKPKFHPVREIFYFFFSPKKERYR